MSPTERTLKKLRAEGYTCAIVEKWNAHICYADSETNSVCLDGCVKRVKRFAVH